MENRRWKSQLQKSRRVVFRAPDGQEGPERVNTHTLQRLCFTRGGRSWPSAAETRPLGLLQLARKKTAIIAAVLIMFWSGSGFADVELVKDGQPAADIVIGKDAPLGVKLAAEDLRKHLELMSGADLPIVEEPSPESANHVYVGANEFTEKLGFKPAEFKNSALEILAKDDHVILDGPLKHWKPSPYEQIWSDSKYLKGSVITGKTTPKPKNFPSPGLKAWQDFCGEKFTTQHLNNGAGVFNKGLGIRVNDDIGPWHAVAELLEQLGVRWYMPYENGTVIPEAKTIVVPDQHLKKEAKFGKREWCFYNAMRQDPEGISWLKRLKAGDHTMILYNHTTYPIYSSYEQQQLHPEYLAKNSKGAYIPGYPTGRGAPRYTNPGFRGAAATYMDKVFECQPTLSAMTIGPPDGGVKVDARDLPKYGKPTDSAAQKASNYVWDFHMFLADHLKKSHPDRVLLYMSGAGAKELPTNIAKFPDNLVVPFGDSSCNRVLKSRNEQVLAARRVWLNKMKELGAVPLLKSPVWDYFLYHWKSRPRYPVIFTASLQEQMKEMLPYADGKFIEIPPVKIKGEDEKTPDHWRLATPGLIHLMVYLQNKLFWNPDLDREKLLDEYYHLFFGPAEAEMREFYEFAEKVWNRQESRSLTETTGFLKEKDVDKYFEILAKARKKAGADSVYDKRIAVIESEMKSLKKLFPGLKRTGPDVQARILKKPVKIDGELDEYDEDAWTTLPIAKTGEKATENLTKATVALTPDKSALILAAVCEEPLMNNLKADCEANDDFSIFFDDVVELYVNTPTRSYFKVVVNPNNAVWTESTDVAIIDRDTLPILWNPDVKTAVKKGDDRWTVEMLIPTDDFGELGPTKEHPWGIQIGRTRFTGGTTTAHAIAPTFGGPYRTLNRWGNLAVKDSGVE